MPAFTYLTYAFLGQEFCRTIQEIVSILIVYEYLPTLYPPDHDVVQDTGRVQTGLSWHGISLPQSLALCQLNLLPASPFIIRMEFKRFVNTFIKIPCVIINTGRRIVYRFIGYNNYMKEFFRTFAAIKSVKAY